MTESNTPLMIICPRCNAGESAPARGSFVAIRCKGCGCKLGWRRRQPDKVEVLAEAEPPTATSESAKPGCATAML